jgi:diguanylate cyclase (GGDEF)-like protein
MHPRDRVADPGLFEAKREIIDNEAVKLLLVEDSDEDAELVLFALKRAGVTVEHRRVQTEADFRRELGRFGPHIVLSDFSMPGFDGLKALDISQGHDPDLPFIFVSGTIGEDLAVEAMKAGACDYVMKGNLTRLASAMRRELREAAARRARRVAEAGLRRAQLLAGLAHIVTRPDGGFESWSETLPALLGVDARAMPRSTREWLARVHPDDRAALRASALEAAAGQARTHVEYRMRGSGGAWNYLRQVMERLEPAPDASGKFWWFNTLQDVTREARSHQKIARLNRVYAVLSGINTLIVRVQDRNELLREACRIAVDHGHFLKAWIGTVGGDATPFRMVAANGGDAGFFGELERKLRERIPLGHGMVAEALARQRTVISNDIERDDQVALRDELLAAGVRAAAVLPLRAAGQSGAVLVLNADSAGFFDEEEMRLLAELAGDISFALENIEKSERIDYLSYYDPLTGLANRTLFHERVKQAVAAAQRDRRKVGLFVVDLERFRAVNDSLGRQAGDALLKMVAERMAAYSRDATWIARTGADHFAVFAPDISSGEELARRTEQRMNQVFGAPYAIADTELRISARVGIALYPNDAGDAETLFRNAEAALKKAKQTGERYLFYRQEMTALVAEKLMLENKLRRALENDEFVLHYQPKVDLETRHIVGVEALIRWQSPELGLVPPGRFIALLEETGLILPVGSWALRRASLDHRRWMERKLRPPRVAVNVSAIQLRQRDFVSVIEQAIIDGPAPIGIDLEITESVVMEDIQGNIDKLKAARALGINIAIDDFGTGYSSLGYLAKLPVQSLKIDRSFVITMHSDANSMTLVSTIISLAHSLHLKVTAEGVETEEQARFLHLLRCDEMQGYLFSKPVPEQELARLLEKQAVS